LVGCNPKPKYEIQENLITFDATTSFVSSAHPRQTDHVGDFADNTLLIIGWMKVEDYMNEKINKKPKPDQFTLTLNASGSISLMRQNAMRKTADWTRLYTNEETEKLYDTIMPSIEQFSLGDLQASRDNYIVGFQYRNSKGAFFHNCLLNDLAPITSLLVQLRLGGMEPNPDAKPKTQQWAKKRFGFFLSETESLFDLPEPK